MILPWGCAALKTFKRKPVVVRTTPSALRTQPRGRVSFGPAQPADGERMGAGVASLIPAPTHDVTYDELRGDETR